MKHSRAVSAYYDKASRIFLKLGGGGRIGVLHRAVWGTGVRTRVEALNFVHDRIIDYIYRRRSGRIIDLGCGVGGSIDYISERVDALFFGITISEYQERVARRRFRGRTGISIHLGDMRDVAAIISSDTIPTLCFAIESLVHLSDPIDLFRSLSTLLNRGDVLVVCDDSLSGKGSANESPDVGRFVKNWRIPGLRTIEQLTRYAEDSGFETAESENLTDRLKLEGPRDRIVRLAQPIARFLAPISPWCASMVGGNALRRATKTGLIEYRITIFIKL